MGWILDIAIYTNSLVVRIGVGLGWDWIGWEYLGDLLLWMG